MNIEEISYCHWSFNAKILLVAVLYYSDLYTQVNVIEILTSIYKPWMAKVVGDTCLLLFLILWMSNNS